MLFIAWGLEKEHTIMFSKPEVFLRTEVQIVTATKEEKREAFLALIVHLHRKSSIPEIGTTAIKRE